MLRKREGAFLLTAIAMLTPVASAGGAAQVIPLLGTWSAKQNALAGAAAVPPAEATLTFSRNGDSISGVMRAGRDEFPLFDVKEGDGNVSFTVVIPGTPYLSLHYSGTLSGNSLSLASTDDGQGRFALTAEREGPPAAAPSASPPAQAAAAESKPAPQPAAPRAAATAPRTPAPTPPAPAAPPPSAAPPAATVGQAIQGSYITRLLNQLPAAPAQPAAPPAPVMRGAQVPSTAAAVPVMRGAPVPPAAAAPLMQGAPVPPVAAPVMRGAPVPPATAPAEVASLEVSRPSPPAAQPPPPPKPSFDLAGEWTAQQASPGSAAPIEAKLAFVDTRGTMRVGREEWPLFDVQGSGDDLTFTLVIPGTPYITIHYRGTVVANEMKLASLDEGQGVFTLTGRRENAPAPVATKAAPPTVAAAVPAPAPPTTIPVAPAPAAVAPAPAPATKPAPTVAAVPAEPSTPAPAAAPPPPVAAAAPPSPVAAVAPPAQPRLALQTANPPSGQAAASSSIPSALALATPPADTVEATLLQRAPVSAPPANPAPAPPPIASLAPPPPAATAPRAATPPAPPHVPKSLARPPLSALPAKLPLPALRDVTPNANVFKVPPMGWASRQKLGTLIDADAIRQAADGLNESGLKAAGYTLVEIDDGWQGERDATGALQGNDNFPDMKGVADYIHGRGLKLGLFASAAPQSCGGFEGSYGHESDDAKTFASWGVDYVIYDWCGAERIYPTQAEQRAAYQQMGDALKASGRDIAYGMSQGGVFSVATWAPKAGANLWRMGDDVSDSWKSIVDAGFAQNGKETFSGSSRWNDPGLLQFGNGGLTADEYRTQMNLWALIAAPMMLGTDARTITRDTVAALANQEVIAVDQDPKGAQSKRVTQAGQTEVWARTLADGSVAVGFFNHGDASAPVAVSWEQLGLTGPRQVRDLWWHQDIGAANDNYVVFLAAHASLLLKFSR